MGVLECHTFWRGAVIMSLAITRKPLILLPEKFIFTRFSPLPTVPFLFDRLECGASCGPA